MIRTAAWVLGALLSGCGVPAVPVAQLDALHTRCVEDMVRQTCRVMNPPAAGDAAAPAVLFVAGVGAVDAAAYAEMRQAGAAMCDTVRQRCASGWGEPACRTARALFGLPGD